MLLKVTVKPPTTGMLKTHFQDGVIEAGTDEAGRGCLAGPVFAAAVVLPAGYTHALLNDSKKLSEKQRNQLRIDIERDAVAYHVASVDNEEIDRINILQASLKAMHLSLDGLSAPFELILVDGNRFKPYKNIAYKTIIKGDATYMSIAAASILAKTYRDEFMEQAHTKYPDYGWLENKGYATEKHRKAIMQHGYTPLHRKTFVLKEFQTQLW